MPREALTVEEIDNVIDTFEKITNTGREGRRRPGPCDSMYDKGVDDAVRLLRDSFRLTFALEDDDA